MKRNNLKILIIITMLLAFMPISTYAFYVDGLQYTEYSSSTVSVKNCGSENNQQTIVIPEIVVYDGVEYTVVAIEADFSTNAKEIFIPKSITKILTEEQGVYGGYVYSYGYFYYCPNLESIIVDSENQVFSSEDGVLFYKDLSSLLYYPEKKANESYEIPDGIVEIFDRAFNDNEFLKSVQMPNTVKYINKSAFACCENLSDVEWSSQIEVIATDAFEETHISTAILPKTLKIIGDDALSSYSTAMTVYCYGMTPASIMRYKGDEQPFSKETLENGVLYVPRGSKNAYLRAEAWRDFHVIEEFDVPSDDTVTDEIDCKISYLNLEGNSISDSNIILSLPFPDVIDGYTFDKWIILEGDLDNGIRIQATYTKDTGSSIEAISTVSTVPKNSTQKIIRKGQIYVYKNGKVCNTTGI